MIYIETRSINEDGGGGSKVEWYHYDVMTKNRGGWEEGSNVEWYLYDVIVIYDENAKYIIILNTVGGNYIYKFDAGAGIVMSD